MYTATYDLIHKHSLNRSIDLRILSTKPNSLINGCFFCFYSILQLKDNEIALNTIETKEDERKNENKTVKCVRICSD